MTAYDSTYIRETASPVKATRMLWIIGVLSLVVMVAVFRYYTHIEPRFVPYNFHALQGEAFLSGHTYLNQKPAAKLLAMRDPYDPFTNGPYVLWDASLYNGRYYLYFGPAPSVVWAVIQRVTGIWLTDPQLALIFTCIGTGSVIVLLLLIASHERMVIGTGLTFAIIAMTLGTWLPFLLRRSSFYEVAISGAYCFSALAMLALWHALSNDRKQYLFTALASLSFGLAVGCRLTFALSIIPFGIALLFMLRHLPWRQKVITLALLCLPWTCCIVALLIFNYERFGSAFETGVHYQLTIYNAQHLNFVFFDAKYLLSNTYLYLLRPLKFGHPFAFPFFYVDFYNGSSLPSGTIAKSSEPVYGLLVNSPFSLWMLAAPYIWLKRQVLSQSARVMILSIGMYGAVMFAVMALFFFSTVRYEVDFAPWLMFFAATQYLCLLSTAETRTGFTLLVAVGSLTAIYGALTGTLSGYCGYLCTAPK